MTSQTEVEELSDIAGRGFAPGRNRSPRHD